MASKKILIQVDVTTKSAEVQINKVVESMNKLDGATTKVNKATKKNSASAGLHNAILMESGRLASDLNYGFTAIANNLGQLFSLFQASADSADGLGAAFKKLLSVQALFLIGGQLIIQNLDKIVKFFKEVVFGVQDLDKVFNKASKTVAEVNGNFELYIATLEDATKSEKEKKIAIEKLNKEYPDYIENLEKADVTIEDVKNKTKEATEQNDLYRDSILSLAISRAAQNEIERISGEILQEEINLRKIQEEQGIKSEEQLKQALIDKQAEIDAEQEKINVLIKSRAQSQSRFATDSFIDKTRLTSLKKEKQALEGNLKSYLGFGETANERIARLKEERDLYIEYVKLGAERNKVDEKTIENTIKLNKGLFDKIEKDNLRLENIAAKFNAKSIKDDTARKIALLKAQEKAQIDAIDATEAYETEKENAKLAVQKYYIREREKVAEKEEEQNKKLRNASLKNTAQHLQTAAGLFAEHTAANKALRVASAVIDTYAGANTALASSPPPFNFIQAAAVIAAGLANVKKIFSTKVPNDRSQSAGGGSMSVEAPDFNVVGQSATSQLVGAVQGQFGGALKAYVVSSEISSAQELDRKINTTATIG